MTYRLITMSRRSPGPAAGSKPAACCSRQVPARSRQTILVSALCRLALAAVVADVEADSGAVACSTCVSCNRRRPARPGSSVRSAAAVPRHCSLASGTVERCAHGRGLRPFGSCNDRADCRNMRRGRTIVRSSHSLYDSAAMAGGARGGASRMSNHCKPRSSRVQ